MRQPRAKPDDEPFADVERLKQHAPDPVDRGGDGSDDAEVWDGGAHGRVRDDIRFAPQPKQKLERKSIASGGVTRDNPLVNATFPLRWLPLLVLAFTFAFE